MTEFGKSPLLDFDDAGRHGLPHGALPGDGVSRGPAGGPGDACGHCCRRAISATGLPQMLTRAELYDLLGYAGYEERDRAYFG